jgi:hypothetical protein
MATMKPRHAAALALVLSQKALDAQVAAAEHIRACDVCRRMFEVAYEEMGTSEFADYADKAFGQCPLRCWN